CAEPCAGDSAALRRITPGGTGRRAVRVLRSPRTEAQGGRARPDIGIGGKRNAPLALNAAVARPPHMGDIDPLCPAPAGSAAARARARTVQLAGGRRGGAGEGGTALPRRLHV